jgi:hypothetical protein
MNTKSLFVLLAVVLLATACAPAIVSGAGPVEPAAPPADTGNSVILPVTGNSTLMEARQAQEPRLQSGEIFLSESDSPDHLQNIQPAVNEAPRNGCFSEDSQPRPQSGCVE